MELLSIAAKNPENITFGTLFVGLLIWVIRSNTDRENRYLDTIKNLTEALKSLDVIERTVHEIKERIDRLDQN